VYLDDGQVFAQWIFQPGRLPIDLSERFALYVRPLVETYRAYGIEAYLRPVNDIHVGGKKIGGTGAAQIGNADVVVGSLMFSFDKRTMAKVLKVSSEKMRDKIVEGLEQYMTTMEELLGKSPDRGAVKRAYVEECAKALGREVVEGVWSAREEEMAQELDERFSSDEWLRQRGGLRPSGVKIHEDVRVVEGAWKAPGGLIRATARLSDGCIDDITLSGDFTMLPAFALGALESALRGVRADEASVISRVREVYRTMNIVSPGVQAEDFAKALAVAGR
jgi:lipoate-protein ligase A